ncbi:hypothetical protein J1605_000127 [Eschrichtius robustus]|uniref:Uncharacterized protein n=1 Tax=Eschrichtius robustus TaxID=9764 RepID=A0AB34HNV6_ESCRO|nr:hypothetical protein J1605_000127 [Eschrichtius robustus]
MPGWSTKSLSSTRLRLPVFSFGFGPASACRSPEGVCSPPRQDGVKGAAASGALAHPGRGEDFWRRQQQPQRLTPVSGVRADNRGSRLSLDSALLAAARACLWASCGALTPSGCVHAANPSPLPAIRMKPEPQLPAPPALAAADFFPDSLPASCGAVTPSGCVHAANPSPLPGIRPKPKPQLPAPPAPAVSAREGPS